jgi:uncharacterized protein YdeI (YjbR/CyaY-like superfamily)
MISDPARQSAHSVSTLAEKMVSMNEITARDAQEWEAWLAAHHEDTTEIWIRIAKKHTGIASVQPDEAIEVALCYGWIDSHRRAGDDSHYLQRYSPRRKRSNWSDINIARAERLIAAGRMRPAGRRAFVGRLRIQAEGNSLNTSGKQL